MYEISYMKGEKARISLSRRRGAIELPVAEGGGAKRHRQGFTARSLRVFIKAGRKPRGNIF